MTRIEANHDRRYAAKLQPAPARGDRHAGVAIGESARRLGLSRWSIRAVVEGRTHREV